MPNYCENDLIITAQTPEQELELVNILTAAKEDRLLDYIAPMPAALAATTAPSNQGDLSAEEKAQLIADYGADNWYNWRVANWGTKWDIAGVDVVEQLVDQIQLCFDSAWAPPVGVYQTLTDRGFSVEAYYNETGFAFAGKFDNGDDTCYDYEEMDFEEDELCRELDDMYVIQEHLEECEEYEKDN